MGVQLIETVEVTGTAAIIELTSIPQDGTDLLLLGSTRRNIDNNYHAIRINGDTGSNITEIQLNGNGSSATTGGPSTRSVLDLEQTKSSETSNTFGNYAIYFSNYAASAATSISIDLVTENNASTAYQRISASIYNVATGITSLETQYAVEVGSTWSLYKITAD